MKLAEGRLSIYRSRKKIKGKTYIWEEARVIIPSKHIDNLREYNGEKILLIIMKLEEIETLSTEKFREKYSKYPIEFFPKKERNIALLSAPNIEIIHAHNVDNPEKAVKIVKAILFLKNKPIVITSSIEALEKALKQARKHINWEEIWRKQTETFEKEKTREKLIRAFQIISEENRIKQLIKKIYRRKRFSP